MLSGQNLKVVQICFPQAIVDDDDPVGAYGDANPVSVDTTGFNHASIMTVIGAIDGTLQALQVYEGDSVASGADDSAFSAITGATVDELPDQTQDNWSSKIDIDLRGGRKRYLTVDITGANGSNGAEITAFCILSDPLNSIQNASDAGVDKWVVV